MEQKNGFVSLVGAGPGDPELLTVRALARLRTADLVLYDALVTPTIVAQADTAQRFCVGKRAGRPAIDQLTINRLMIRGARRGKRVVRLKSGDPFVLARGGEETIALASAGITFEVVPGITNAVAAPELAGIPLTHRGVASGFLVVSGHSEAVFGRMLDDLSPHSLTLVVLMGLASRARLARRLIRHGWAPKTPAAIVLGAGTIGMRTWVGRLADLETAAVDTANDVPGTIIVGEVVTLRRFGLDQYGSNQNVDPIEFGRYLAKAP